MAKKEKEEEKKPAEEKSTAVEGDRGQSKTAAGQSTASDGDRGQSKPAEESKPAEKPAEPDWKTLYALTLADFDNYKKRAARDREEVYRYAESDILKDVLPAVDNLALALANAAVCSDKNVAAPGKAAAGGVSADAKCSDKNVAAPGDATFLSRQNYEAFVKGVQLVYDTLLKSLKDHGAEPFDSVGKELDTEKMEAIATLPSETVEEGKVSIESKRGWMLKDKVLRAAQVVVSSGKPA